MVLQRQDSTLTNIARPIYHLLRGIYQQVRAGRNRFFNLLDCPLIILIYHRVAELSNDPEMIAVSPANFRAQLEYLKQHHPILRFTDDWSAQRQPAVVVSFDDGYADNAQNALPILEDLQVPATFFVSTGCLDSDKQFWWDRLERVLLREGLFPECFELHDQRYAGSWETATLEQRQNLYAMFSIQMRKIDNARQADWLMQLERWAPPVAEDGQHRVLSLQELQQLTASPWATIGAHTVSHAALSALPAEQQREEIFRSRQELEYLLGSTIDVFSYPFGRKVDYNRTSVELCREAGFSRVASNFPGQVHRWTDPLQLPRHLVRNWDQATFAAELKKFWTR